MRLRTDHKTKALAVAMLMYGGSCYAQLTESNPTQYAAIAAGTALVNRHVKSQTTAMTKTAAIQGAVAAEFTVMKKWEDQYNSYLKTATGFADALKAGSTLYADGVQMLRHLYEIKRAINANPVGIGTTFAMNDLYAEVVTECLKTYEVLKKSIAVGGQGNMLTGKERTELLWMLSDALAELNRKLHGLAISIAYHNMTDVWNKYTAGMFARSHATIAQEALERWKRAQQVSLILNP